MKKRIPALLLAALLACSSVYSCGKKEENKQKTNVTVDDEYTVDGVKLELPDIDGGGEDFDVFIAYGVANQDFVTPEEENGDAINDIRYQRNHEVMNKFNVKFQVKEGISGSNSEGTPIIRSLIQSGDDTYEVFINVQHVGVPLIYEDLFVEWNENMPHANLDNPWWYQNVTRDLNYNDKIYVAAGAYNFHCLKGMGVLSFNKTMMDELELDYPYQMVKDGEWTVDKLIEYNKKAIKDLNGDGIMKTEDDRFGLAGWQYEMTPAIFVGMGGNPVTKDDDDMPILNLNDERTFNVIDKMLEVFADGNGAFRNAAPEPYAKTGNMFKEGRLMFHDTNLDQLPGLREMEDDFGAIPFPKLDKEQEEYYSRVVNYTSLTYIPVTNQKLELTSAILEHMAFLSYRDLIPAFYDVILTVKTNRDYETEEMVDIVRKGARFMDENFFGTGGLNEILNAKQNILASRYASQEDAWLTKLEGYIEFWEK
ncbi:MAG: hypothetical protein E7583_02150 [Ruminococcaceae bacterium]|nr:hypothetical protein [Oscillospiraceae bacterium]